MINNLDVLCNEIDLLKRNIFLFGHCNASLELADLLESRGFTVKAILDNSVEKNGISYKNIKVIFPTDINYISDDSKSVVLIVSRFYASMSQQLREIGYNGLIRKIIDYNTYAEYSLSDDTVNRMIKRKDCGIKGLMDLSLKYPQTYKVFCPFPALGDIYFMISYWEEYAHKRSIGAVVFCVVSKVLKDVISLFGEYQVEVYDQAVLDSMIQAVIYTNDENSFIAHQDRPYVINLHKALYNKRITLEQIYCCGVYGLPQNTLPAKPMGKLGVCKGTGQIKKGKTVIISPYAKSVTPIDKRIWDRIVEYYTGQGYECYTNVFGDEKPLDHTVGISPSILELISVVEYAGTFIGIRSGLCDVIHEADAKKIVLYPDYYYCDTKWKAIDIYRLSNCINIEVGDDDYEKGFDIIDIIKNMDS